MTMFGLNLFGKVKPKEVQNPSFVSDTNARGTTRSVAHQHLHEEQLFLREENKRLQEMVRVHERECVKLSAGLDENEKTISKLNSVLKDKERETVRRVKAMRKFDEEAFGREKEELESKFNKFKAECERKMKNKDVIGSDQEKVIIKLQEENEYIRKKLSRANRDREDRDDLRKQACNNAWLQSMKETAYKSAQRSEMSDSQRKRLDELERRITALQEGNADLVAKNKQLDNELYMLQHPEIFSSHEEQTEASRQVGDQAVQCGESGFNIGVLESEVADLQKRCSSLTKECDDKDREIEELKHAKLEEGKKNQENQHKLKKLSDELQVKVNELGKLGGELKSAQQTLNEKQGLLERMMSEKQHFQKQADEYKNQFERLKKEAGNDRKVLESKYKAEAQRREEAQSAMAKLAKYAREERAIYSQQISDAEKKVDIRDREIRKLEDAKKELESLKSKLLSENQCMRTKIGSLSDDNARLQERLDSEDAAYKRDRSMLEQALHFESLRLERAQDEIEEQRKENADLKTRLADTERVSDLRKRKIEMLFKENGQLTQENNVLAKKFKASDESLQKAKGEALRLQHSKAELEQEVEQSQQETERVKREQSKLKQSLAATKEKSDLKDHQIRVLTDGKEALQFEKRRLKKALDISDRKNSALNVEVDKLNTQLKTEQEKSKKLGDDNTQLSANLEVAEEKSRLSKRKAEVLEHENNELSKQLKKAEGNYKQAQNRLDQQEAGIKKERQQYQQSLQNTAARNSDLQRTNSLLKAKLNGYQNAVEQQKKKVAHCCKRVKQLLVEKEQLQQQLRSERQQNSGLVQTIARARASKGVVALRKKRNLINQLRDQLTIERKKLKQAEERLAKQQRGKNRLRRRQITTWSRQAVSQVNKMAKKPYLNWKTELQDNRFKAITLSLLSLKTELQDNRFKAITLSLLSI